MTAPSLMSALDPSPELRMTTVLDLTRTAAATLSIQGELDAWTGPVLAERLERLFDDGARHLCLDLGAVSFCDVSGLNVLLQTRNRFSAAGGSVQLHHPCASLLTLLRLFCLNTQLGSAVRTDRHDG